MDESVGDIVSIAKKVEPYQYKENAPVALRYSCNDQDHVENAPVILSSSCKVVQAPVNLSPSRKIIPVTVHNYSPSQMQRLTDAIAFSGNVTALISQLGIELKNIDSMT